MKIALIQQSAGPDKEKNIAKGLKAMEQAASLGANVVCFAELAFEPFYPQERPETDVKTLAETIPGPITNSISSLAKKLGVAVVLNLYEKDGDETYDTSPVFDADGSLLGKTRMVHVPDYACFHEKNYYQLGDKGAPVFETAFGKIGVAICYDRHYPEYMRALAVGGAELVVIPQAGAVDEWPDDLYEAEMRVSAFQNGFFTALTNRVGKEKKLNFSGESFVCDPMGKVIARAKKEAEDILICDIDVDLVKQSHARNLFLADRRPELYDAWIGKKI